MDDTKYQILPDSPLRLSKGASQMRNMTTDTNLQWMGDYILSEVKQRVDAYFHCEVFWNLTAITHP